MRYFNQHSQQELLNQTSQFHRMKSQTEKMMINTKIQVHTAVPGFFQRLVISHTNFYYVFWRTIITICNIVSAFYYLELIASDTAKNQNG